MWRNDNASFKVSLFREKLTRAKTGLVRCVLILLLFYLSCPRASAATDPPLTTYYGFELPGDLFFGDTF